MSISSSKLWQTLETCSQLENDSTGSPASFELAKYWVSNCVQNHADCPEPSSGWLPKRVIDVSPSDGSVIPRLIETTDSAFDCTHKERRYVSLSHCWGTKQLITTTMANIRNHKRGICPKDLSQTFRDAIQVTRSLGERYLWIDSLCIMQDSTQDWKTQSVQMCNIYQRSVFTIMAAHASGGDEGCFVSR
ncbi:HET-domain-containing protein, partial [Setomelanomma holmii]